MKKSLFFKLLCVFSFVFGLFSVSTGLSDYIIDKTTYDENGTLSNKATSANDNGEKVTVSFKTLIYEKINSAWENVPGYTDVNIGGGSDHSKLDALKNFFSNNVVDTGLNFDKLGDGTYDNNGKGYNGKGDYYNCSFKLIVLQKIEVTGWINKKYSGKYTIQIRKHDSFVANDSIMQTLMCSRGSTIDSLNVNELFSNKMSGYHFLGVRESKEGNLLDGNTRLNENKTLYACFIKQGDMTTANRSFLTETINSATGLLECWKGNSDKTKDIATDPSYNQTGNKVYLGTSSLKTAVKAGATIKFCLNDGSENLEYQRKEKISFDPENSEHDRQYTISLLNDLIINGELIIGGEYGIKDDSGELQGNINNRYVCFDLNGHKLIVNKGGKLTSYGLIKDSVGTGRIEVNGGRIYTLATVADYRSGGYTTSIIGAKVFPFNLFALPYLKCKIIFNYSLTNGWGELIAGAHITLGALFDFYKTITIDLNIFGPGSSTSNKYLFSCANGINDVSKVIMDTYDYSDNKVLNSSEQTGLAKLNKFCFNQKMKVNAYSTDIYLGYIDISVTFGKKYTVNTKDLVFPISSFFEICMFSSSLTIKQRMQFSCGSSLIFDQNSKLIFDYSGDYVGNLSLLDIPLYYWDNRTNKLIDNAISTSIVQKDNFYNVAAYWKYYSMPKMKVYGKILFRKGNSKNYQIAGTLDFNEKNVGTIDSNGNINLYNDNEYNCFTMLKQNGVKITTYGLDFLNLGTNKAQHTAGYSRPLISNGIAYVVDDTNNMAGVFDNKTGVFTDAASSKQYIVNNNVENVSFSISDAGSATIDECSYDEKTHIISSNGKQYVYASNLCAEYNASAGTADYSRLGIGSVTVRYNSEQNRWLRG